MNWSLRFSGLLILLACGCAGATAPSGSPLGGEQNPVYGGTLTLQVSTDPINFDPDDQGRTTPGNQGLAMAYNSLLGFQSGPGVDYSEMVLVPELAERWEVSPDARVVTFHLRRGVKFVNVAPVNGRELTAADVKFTMEFYTRTGEFKDRRGAESRNQFMYEGLAGVKVLDSHSVQVQFKEPFVPFISYAASDWNPMLPREIYDEDRHFKDRMAGTGTFRVDLQASQTGSRWVWKKNPNYWEEGKPYLDEVRWLVIPDDGTARAAFQTKQVDVLGSQFFHDVQELAKANSAARTYKYLQPHPNFLRLSQARGSPFTDIKLRRAVALAIDRDEISRTVAGGEALWAVSGAMPGLLSDAEIRELAKQDLNEAKRLVAEAGYPDGLTVSFPTDPTRSQSDFTLFQLIQAQLKKAGITMDIKLVDRNVQRQMRRAGDYGIDGGTGLAPLEADNDSILFGEFHSSVAGSTNYSYIKDPELDRLLEGQRREPNPEQRRELMRSAVRRIADQVWMIGLIYPPRWDVVQSHVHNYQLHFGSKAPYLFAWVQK